MAEDQTNTEPDEAQDDKDILEEAKERAALCQEYYSSEYQRGKEDVRFALLGEQWPEDIVAKRQKEGRPCLTENRVHASLLQVINGIRQSRPAINVSPVDDNADIETARVLKGIVRNIEVQSGADNVYDTAALGSVSAGYGWMRIITDYADDESFDQEIKLVRIPDFASVMLDPNSKELDGSDAEYGFIFSDVEHDAFESQYPDADAVSIKGYDQERGWCSEKTVRVAEYFRKVYTKRTLVLTANGTFEKSMAEMAGFAVLNERDVQVVDIEWYKLSGNSILEKTEWLGKYIPLIPVYGEEVVVDGRRRYYSLTWHGKDAQRRFNYWNTANTEIIALQPRAPFVGITGQFKTASAKWSSANNQSHSYLEYDPVKLPDGTIAALPPQRQAPPTGSPSMFQETMAAAEGIKATLGIFDASLGANGNEKSGKAILARQAQGDNSTFHFTDNLQTSIRHVGRILIDLIPKIYTGQRMMRIIGDDDAKMQVPINQPAVKGPKGEYFVAKPGQEYDALFRLDTGKYDVVATVGPSYVTKRQEAATALQEIMQSMPQAAEIIGDIYFKNLDIPEADLIAERLRQRFPAMQDQKDPKAQQLQQAGEAIKAMQAQMAQMEQALQQKRAKDMAETQSEIAKNQADVAKINADIQKTEAETAKIMAELAAGPQITPEHLNEIVSTIHRLEVDLKDTANAVDVILSHEEAQQGSLHPEQMQMPEGNPTNVE